MYRYPLDDFLRRYVVSEEEFAMLQELRDEPPYLQFKSQTLLGAMISRENPKWRRKTALEAMIADKLRRKCGQTGEWLASGKVGGFGSFVDFDPGDWSDRVEFDYRAQLVRCGTTDYKYVHIRRKHITDAAGDSINPQGANIPRGSQSPSHRDKVKAREALKDQMKKFLDSSIGKVTKEAAKQEAKEALPELFANRSITNHLFNEIWKDVMSTDNFAEKRHRGRPPGS